MLSQRVLTDERLELPDDVGVSFELEVGVDPLLERDEPKLLEPADLALCERFVGEIGQRRTSPDVERLPQQRRARSRIRSVTRLCRQRREALQVEAARLHPKQITRRARLDRLRPEQLP